MAARCSCGCRSLVRWRPRVLRVTVTAVAPLRAGALACSASLLRPSLPLVAACLVRSDSPRLLRNWRVCHPVVTDRCCAPAFLAGCGTRSARHAAPSFRDGRLYAPSATRSINQRRAVRSGGAARCSSERKVTLRKGVFEGQTARPTRDVDRTATDALPKGIRGHSTTRERSDRDCQAVNQSATRRPQRPSGPALRGFGSREGGTSSAFGGGCQPRRATDVSASETWWSERVRAARGRGRERTARSEHLRPRAREDGAERTLAPWWSERVRAARGRGRERTARSAHSRPGGASASAQPGAEGAKGRRGANNLLPRAREDGAERTLASWWSERPSRRCSAQKRNRLGRVPEAGMRLRGLEPPRVLPH